MIVWAVVGAIAGGFWGALLGVVFGPMNAAIAAAVMAAVSSAIFATSFWGIVSFISQQIFEALRSELQPSLGLVITALVGGAISTAAEEFIVLPTLLFWTVYGGIAGMGIGMGGQVKAELMLGAPLDAALVQAIAPGLLYALYGAGVGLVGGAIKALAWSKFLTLLQSASGSMSGAIWSAVIGVMLGGVLGAIVGAVVGTVLPPAIATSLVLLVMISGWSLLWAWGGSYK